MVTYSAQTFVPKGGKGGWCDVAVAFGDGEREEEGYNCEGGSAAAAD